MKASNELREKMWELCYDLLPADERKSLVATIKSDPQAARLYAEVRLQADLVGFAAKVDDSSLVLSPEGPESSKSALAPAAARRKEAAVGGGSAPLARRSWIAWLPAVAALFLVGLIGWGAYRPLSEPQMASALVVTEVEMPGRMLEGLSSKIALRSRSLAGTPQSVEMDVKLVDARGEVLHREVMPTDASGQATITLPGQAVQQGVRIEALARPGQSAQLAELDARDGAAADYVAARLPVEPQPPLVYVVPERPQAEEGEPMKVATYSLSRFGLEVQSMDGVQEKTFDLSAREPVMPGLQAGVEGMQGAERPFAAGVGDRKSGASAPEQQLAQQLAQQTVRAKRSAPQAADENDADKYQRGVQDLQPTVLASEGSKQLAKDADVAKSRPEPDVAIDGRQTGGTLRHKELRESSGGGLYDRSDAAPAESAAPLVLDSGAPVPVEVPGEAVAKNGQLIVQARMRGAVVASQPLVSLAQSSEGARKESAEAAPPAPSGQATRYFALELPPEADGEIQVQVVDASQSPPQVVSQQHFFRQSTRQLKLALAEAANEFKPGQNVALRFQVLDEHDQPQQALLAVRVWSEAHIEASGQEPVMLADVLRGSSAAALYENESLQGRSMRLARRQAAGPTVDALAMAQVPQDAKKEAEAGINRLEAAPPAAPAEAPPPPAPPSPAESTPPAPAPAPAATGPAATGPAPTAPAPTAPPAPRPAAAPETASAPAPADAPAPTGAVGGQVAETEALVPGTSGLQPDAQTYALEILAGGDHSFAPLVVSNEVAVKQVSQTIAARSDEAWRAWQAIVGRVLIAGAGLAIGGLLLLFLLRMPVRAASGTLTLLAAAASLIVGAFWIGGDQRAGVQVAAARSATAERLDEARFRDLGESDAFRAPTDAEEAKLTDDQPLATDALSDRSAASQLPRANQTERFDYSEQNAPAAEDAIPLTTAAGAAPPPASGPTATPGQPPVAAGLGGYAPANKPDAGGSAGFGSAAMADRAGGAAEGRSATRRALERPLANLPTPDAPAEAPTTSSAEWATRDRARLAPVHAAPASLYFEPRLVTDPNGVATVEFQMPQVEGDYRVLIDAFGYGRIGSAQLSISCRK